VSRPVHVQMLLYNKPTDMFGVYCTCCRHNNAAKSGDHFYSQVVTMLVMWRKVQGWCVECLLTLNECCMVLGS